jgi:hypothetical protein
VAREITVPSSKIKDTYGAPTSKSQWETKGCAIYHTKTTVSHQISACGVGEEFQLWFPAELGKKENPNNSESDFTTSFHPDNIPSACHARRLYPANAPRNCNHAFTAG